MAPRTKSAVVRVPRGKRVFERVSERIRSDISAGVYKPGGKLPAEREIAVALGFSRSAVREALRSLEADGILELQNGPTGGAIVRAVDGIAVTKTLTDVMVLGRIPLSNLTEVRTILLTKAAELACARGSEKSFQEMEDTITATEAAVALGEDATEIYAQFHKILGAATNNELLRYLIEATTDIFKVAYRNKTRDVTQDFLDLRRNVVRQLRARDPVGSARAITENLTALHQFVLEHPENVDEGQGALEPLGALQPNAIVNIEIDRTGPTRTSPAIPAFVKRDLPEDVRNATQRSPESLEAENYQLKILLAEAILDLNAFERSRPDR
jgi:GntR family transcriptional regulator, transcriptional repressor for pyruvate dehydrogenase complex